jgi:tetratricopeptide (TPR) repeat protein
LTKARTVRTWPGLISRLGYAYAVSGKRDEAAKLIEELSRQRYPSPAAIAIVYLGLGDKDRALELLDKAYEERASELVWLKVDPIYDPLRADPHFIALFKKAHLDE